MQGRLVCLALAVSLSGAGCGTTVRISDTAPLTRPETTGEISVYTLDGALYRLTNYGVRDSLLTGTGTLMRHGTRSTFRGSVPLDSVRYAETHHRGVLKGALFIGAVGGMVAAADFGRGGYSVNETLKHWPERWPAGAA